MSLNVGFHEPCKNQTSTCIYKIREICRQVRDLPQSPLSARPSDPKGGPGKRKVPSAGYAHSVFPTKLLGAVERYQILLQSLVIYPDCRTLNLQLLDQQHFSSLFAAWLKSKWLHKLYLTAPLYSHYGF